VKRITWLAGTCLLGGLAVVVVVSGLRTQARAAALLAPVGTELLLNPGFEDATGSVPDHWRKYGGTLTQVGSPVHSGSYAARFESNTSSTKWVYQVVSVTQAVVYVFSAWAVKNDTNVEEVYLRVSWYASTDGSGTEFSRADSTTRLTTDDPAYRFLTTGPITAPAGARSARVRLMLNPVDATACRAYFDDACFQQVGAAEPAADLVVAKAGPVTATPGSLITYHVALSNTGSITATGTLITDTLPAAVDLVSQTSPFTCTGFGRSLVWRLGDVPTGTQYLITVTGRVTDTACGIITNLVAATTTASETVTGNNVAAWATTVGAAGESQVLISAVLYDGYQSGDPDEAVQLVNAGTAPVDLKGWELCKDTGSALDCRTLPPAVLSPTARIWLARKAVSFTTSFGFPPDYEMDGWLLYGLANAGDEVVLRDDRHAAADVVVYKGGQTAIVGWAGPAVQPCSVGREAGQILYRIPDETTGLPIADTDTAADWIQYSGDVAHGRRVLYPGWDLDPLFWPLTTTERAAVVAGVAPDNAFDVVSQTIARAQHTISVEVYALRHPDVIAALVQKAREGVGVAVLLEGGQAGVGTDDPRWQQELWACQQIEAAGGRCWFMIHETIDRVFNRYDYLHAKFLVVDGEWVLITSQNLSASSLPSDDKSNGTYGSRGVVLATDAPSVVARAAEIFARDLDPAHHNDILRWNTAYTGDYGPPDPAYTPVLTVPDYVTYTVHFPDPLTVSGTFGFELFTAPEAALRQSDALLGLLARAGVSDMVYVEQMYEHVDWGDNPADAPNLRLEAYVAAARRGATVRILLNGGTFGQEFYQTTNASTVAYVNQIAHAEGLDLQAAGGDPTQWGIHSKMVLVWLHDEGAYVHVSSINGSEGSNKINREMALQVKSDAIYRYLTDVFRVDWWRSHPLFLPLVMRHYTPPAPPVNYVVLSEVMYRPYIGDPPGNGEWVELYNPTDQPADISGWSLGDAATPDEYGSGTYTFPAGTVLPADGVIVVAQQAADVAFRPDFEVAIDPDRDDPAVPNVIPAGAWDGFGLALGNDGDEVILCDGLGADVDVVVWDDPADDPVVKGSYPGVIAWRGLVKTNWSLERRPPYYDTDDCSVDFFSRYPATPGTIDGGSVDSRR